MCLGSCMRARAAKWLFSFYLCKSKDDTQYFLERSVITLWHLMNEHLMIDWSGLGRATMDLDTINLNMASPLYRSGCFLRSLVIFSIVFTANWPSESSQKKTIQLIRGENIFFTLPLLLPCDPWSSVCRWIFYPLAPTVLDTRLGPTLARARHAPKLHGFVAVKACVSNIPYIPPTNWGISNFPFLQLWEIIRHYAAQFALTTCRHLLFVCPSVTGRNTIGLNSWHGEGVCVCAVICVFVLVVTALMFSTFFFLIYLTYKILQC